MTFPQKLMGVNSYFISCVNKFPFFPPNHPNISCGVLWTISCLPDDVISPDGGAALADDVIPSNEVVTGSLLETCIIEGSELLAILSEEMTAEPCEVD